MTERIFIQIGAATGNDAFMRLCQQYAPTRVILVEPFEANRVKLRQAYSNAPFEVIIEECAIIADPTLTEIALVRAHSNNSDEHWPTILGAGETVEELAHFLRRPAHLTSCWKSMA